MILLYQQKRKPYLLYTSVVWVQNIVFDIYISKVINAISSFDNYVLYPRIAYNCLLPVFPLFLLS